METNSEYKFGINGMEQESIGDDESPLSSSLSVFYKSSKWLNVLFITLISCMGIYGNLMSMALFKRKYEKSRRNQKLIVYLIALALSDLCVLVFHYADFTFRSWINLLGAYTSEFNFVDKCLLCCKLFPYVRNVFRTISIYILVMLTFQRFVILYHPLKKSQLLSGAFILKLAALILIVSLLANSSTIFVNTLVKNPATGMLYCCVNARLLNVQFAFDMVFVFISIILPMVFLFTFSVILFKHIRKNLPKQYSLCDLSCMERTSRRQRMTAESTVTKSILLERRMQVSQTDLRTVKSTSCERFKTKPDNGSNISLRFKTKYNQSILTTYIFVLISKWFIIFHLPYLISWIVYHILMKSRFQKQDSFNATYSANKLNTSNEFLNYENKIVFMKSLMNIFEILYLLNYSINFFLYLFNVPWFKKAHKQFYNFKLS